MGNFCIIGPKVTSAIDRSWFNDKEAAAKHGEALARKSYRSSGGAPVKLYIVEVVGVVECGMPSVTVREPNADDAAEEAAGETESDESEPEGYRGKPQAAAKTGRTWRGNKHA